MYSLGGLFHTACGVLSLLLGAWIFVTRKGTRMHRLAGWGYVGSMACLNGSGLGLYHLTGAFNVFHALAIFSLASVTVGVVSVFGRRRWRKGLWRHYQYMAWSYVGLLAATCNEAFVRIPAFQRWTASTVPALPLIAMAAIVAFSGVIIMTAQKRVLQRYEGNVQSIGDRRSS